MCAGCVFCLYLTSLVEKNSPRDVDRSDFLLLLPRIPIYHCRRFRGSLWEKHREKSSTTWALWRGRDYFSWVLNFTLLTRWTCTTMDSYAAALEKGLGSVTVFELSPFEDNFVHAFLFTYKNYCFYLKVLFWRQNLWIFKKNPCV